MVNLIYINGDIKIGDVLRIRQWDDMLSEFSLTDKGSIRGKNNVFSEKMRYLCGKTFTVSSITHSMFGCLNYHSTEGLEYTRNDGCSSKWSIHDWMLEPYNTVINCSSADEVSALLFD